MVDESFAAAHSLAPGDRITVIVNGRRQGLLITALGQSPEFVYQLPPGSLFPDHRRFGVIWA